MNVRKLAGLLVASALAANVPAMAEDKHGAEGGHQHGETHKHGEEQAHFEKKTFASVKEAWAFVTTQVAEAEKHVASKTVEPVHEIGEQLEGAIHTLEEKSDMVAAEQRTKFTAVLKQLDKAADELHHAGEDKNADAAGIAVKKIKGLLPAVEAMYPAGALN